MFGLHINIITNIIFTEFPKLLFFGTPFTTLNNMYIWEFAQSVLKLTLLVFCYAGKLTESFTLMFYNGWVGVVIVKA